MHDVLLEHRHQIGRVQARGNERDRMALDALRQNRDGSWGQVPHFPRDNIGPPGRRSLGTAS
jgi:hypothetical protein